jgi:hypothetical protein
VSVYVCVCVLVCVYLHRGNTAGHGWVLAAFELFTPPGYLFVALAWDQCARLELCACVTLFHALFDACSGASLSVLGDRLKFKLPL